MASVSFIRMYAFIIIHLCLLAQWQHTATATGTGTCRANEWPQHRPDADIRFGLLISKNFYTFTEADTKDCTLTSDALQHYMAVEWLVENLNRANNGTGYIPGITIGFDGLNDCSMPEFAARNSVSFTSKYLPYTTTQCTSEELNSTHAGFVMVGGSSVAKEVASIMRDSPVPIISATATLPELSDSQLYPNFFRTVPSDIHQMTFIAELLRSLSWTYIAVAYQDSLYGNSSLNILTQKAQEMNICIHKALKLPGNSFHIGDEFKQVLSTAKDESIAVVVIADVQHTQEFLCNLAPFSTNKIHFIMTEAVNKNVFTKCKPNSWMFTISTDTEIELTDLKSYINTKYQTERNKGAGEKKHPIIAEYLKQDRAPKFGNLVEGSLAPYIPSTINSVLALVESMRALHQESCRESTDVCDLMRSKLNEKRVLELLRSNAVDYDSINLDVLKGGVAFTFNQDSNDIIPVNNLNEYTVYFLDNDQYKSVGSFSNGQMQLDSSKLEGLSPDYSPVSVCTGRCDSCLHKGQIPTVFLEGDVYIIGVFSIHEANLFECGSWRQLGNDAIIAESFIYAIKLLRAKTGIKFGAIGFDDCYSPLRITSLLTDYMANINPSNDDMFPFHVPREKIVGAIGCRSSGCTLPTASIFMPQKIPLISYAASTPDLDDRINYPYFLRTVPSDVFQAQVMVDVIKALGWEYVGLLYVKNNYGSKGMKAFRNIVDQEGSGVCVPTEFAITEENDQELDNKIFSEAYVHFIILRVKVVVFFGIDARFKSFIKNMEANKKRHHERFIFLASEDWGINKKILEAGEDSARGSITLKLQEVGSDAEPSFKNHLREKRPSPGDPNIWYREFWQNHFGCNFKGGLINEFQSECNSSLKLSDADIDSYVSNQRMVHAMNAVISMGNAFKNIKEKQCGGKFPCSFLSSNPEGTRQEIMKQTQLMSDGESRAVFDKNGNGAIGFEVYNIQKLEGGGYDYVQVGTFFGPQTNELNVKQFKFYNESGGTISVMAKCSGILCDKCKYKPTQPVTQPTTGDDDEESNSDYKDPDILIISLIIVLFIALAVLVAVLYLCFKKKYKDIEKKLEKSDDQIYAEPDRHVYPGPCNASGNGLIFSDPNFSPYQDSSYRTSSHAIGAGLNNPAYSPDSENVDSVSQFDAPRRQIRNDSNAHGLSVLSGNESPALKNPNNSRVNSAPVPHFSGRPMPSTSIDGRNNNADDEGVPMWLARSSTVSEPHSAKRPQSDVGTSQISVISSPTGFNHPHPGESVVVIPYSSAPNAVRSNSQESDPVTYYIRDANGQLTALVPPTPAPRTYVQSDAASSVVADHGPHSQIPSQNKLMQYGQMPNPVPHSSYLPQQMFAIPVNTVIPPTSRAAFEVMEMKDMGSPQPHLRHHHGHPPIQAITETPLTDNSPLHYASPVHAPMGGHVSETVMVHQLANAMSFQNQAINMPMEDPDAGIANHFRQLSNHHWQAESRLSEDVVVPNSRFSVGNVNREEAYQYIEPSTTIPDVVASGSLEMLPPITTDHLNGKGDLENLPVDSSESNTDVKYYQTSKGQTLQSGVYSPISNV